MWWRTMHQCSCCYYIVPISGTAGDSLLHQRQRNLFSVWPALVSSFWLPELLQLLAGARASCRACKASPPRCWSASKFYLKIKKRNSTKPDNVQSPSKGMQKKYILFILLARLTTMTHKHSQSQPPQQHRAGIDDERITKSTLQVACILN